MLNPAETAERLRRSDEKAFEEFFRAYRGAIHRFIRYRIGDPEAASDLAQDTFAILWDRRHTIDPKKSVQALLYTVAGNLTNNWMRHRKVEREYRSELEWASRADDPEPDRTFLREQILRRVEELPEQPRIVFLMSRVEDLSYREIAERLSLSISCV